MNSDELKQLAQDRVDDAIALLAANRWAGAYHLTGFAVECGLKACVLKYLAKGTIFDDPKYLKDLGECRTHDLDKLVRLSGLKDDQESYLKRDENYRRFWTITKDWNESSRYTQTTEAKARDLFEAVTNKPDGVLEWIRLYW
ncbi:MAG TPA: hypothetical protein VG406_12200 [Isosphaeraceae bacterium]|nr:hypothetical protein [Isosphaeraceae bacterium]